MKNKILITTLIIVIVALCISVGFIIYAMQDYASLFKVKHVRTTDYEPKNQNKPVIEVNKSNVSAEDKKEDVYKFNTDSINIMLLGLDKDSSKARRDYKVFRTDTIILLVLDFKNNRVDLVSIPRDSYVSIAGRDVKDKINACLYYGRLMGRDGYEVLMNTVSDFFGGVPVNYYIGLDMDLFVKTINDMGGLWYDVDVRVPIKNNPAIETGYQRLNGFQALKYARYRHTRMGDIDRIGRQQRMMYAIFDQLKNANQIKNIPKFYTNVKDNVYTNLDLKQIAALALFGQKLNKEDISMHSVKGYFLDMNGVSYWGIDQAERQRMVKELFDIYIPIEVDDRALIKK